MVVAIRTDGVIAIRTDGVGVTCVRTLEMDGRQRHLALARRAPGDSGRSAS
jgi:hypothetical protein